MKRKKIVILSYSDFSSDPRIIRQIKALEKDYDIVGVGTSPALSDKIQFVSLVESYQFKLTDFHFNYPSLIRKPISIYILLKKESRKLWKSISSSFVKALSSSLYFEREYWYKSRRKFVSEFPCKDFDLIIANDIHTLPIACRLAKGKIPVFFDAHEYHPRELENNADWLKNHQPFIIYLCKKYIPQVAIMSTVCAGIAKEYETHFGIRPIVITNATDFKELMPSQVSSEKIKLIHHGAAIAERHIELMIDMMALLNQRFSLDLMLIPTQPEYLEKITNLIKGKSNIRLLPPVPTEEISKFTNTYDVGLFLLPPVNFNYEYALPNKLFEFIQARLAIAIGPSPEMAAFVIKYDLGLVSEDFSPHSLAAKLEQLTIEKIGYYKAQSDKYAFELSAEQNKALILSTVQKLLA